MMPKCVAERIAGMTGRLSGRRWVRRAGARPFGPGYRYAERRNR
jgi:hypothetical protein